MTTALGKITFLDTPDVSGDLLIKQTDLTSQLTNIVVPGTEGITLPNGTTAQRPTVPQTGETRFNTTTGLPEVYAQGTWLPYARIIQVASGAIPIKTGTITPKLTTATTTAPTSTETTAVDIWSQSFTPLVAGSSIVVQYTLSAYVGTASRTIYTSLFAGTTCIGMTAAWAATGSTTTVGATVSLTMQAVYTAPSTATFTMLGRLGLIIATTATATTYGVNTLQSGASGNAMVTEYRILEMI